MIVNKSDKKVKKKLTVHIQNEANRTSAAFSNSDEANLLKPSPEIEDIITHRRKARRRMINTCF